MSFGVSLGLRFFSLAVRWCCFLLLSPFPLFSCLLFRYCPVPLVALGHLCFWVFAPLACWGAAFFFFSVSVVVFALEIGLPLVLFWSLYFAAALAVAFFLPCYLLVAAVVFIGCSLVLFLCLLPGRAVYLLFYSVDFFLTVAGSPLLAW